MGKHELRWQQALPIEVPDAKVYQVLEQGRELLRRLSGGARDIRFRHTVEDKEATIGGPLGQKIWVCYITLVCQFEAPDFALPGETQGLMKQYRMQVTHRDVLEAAAKAYADRRKELERAAKEAKEQAVDPIRDFPELVETVPAAGVPLDKMLVSDAELQHVASTPAGVSIFDSAMLPTDDDQIN